MFIDVEEREDGTYNDYGVKHTRYTPTMYIDVDNIFIRQGLRELPLHDYLQAMMVMALEDVIDERFKKDTHYD